MGVTQKGLHSGSLYQLSSSHNTIRRLYEFLVIAYGQSMHAQ